MWDFRRFGDDCPEGVKPQELQETELPGVVSRGTGERHQNPYLGGNMLNPNHVLFGPVGK